MILSEKNVAQTMRGRREKEAAWRDLEQRALRALIALGPRVQDRPSTQRPANCSVCETPVTTRLAEGEDVRCRTHLYLKL